MKTVDLTEYLSQEAESYRRSKAMRDELNRKMRMVAGDIEETLRKNLKKGDRVRMRTSPEKKAIDYIFDSVCTWYGMDKHVSIIVETDNQRRVIPAISEDGEMFPGYSEIYVVGKNIKLK